MRNSCKIGVALFVAVALAVVGRATNHAMAQADGGWTVLFDGKNLDNWSPIGTANWRIEDGAVVADNGNGFLVSKNSYTDFDFKTEFFIEEKTNSGVFIRCTDPNRVTGMTAYEVNIWDSRPDPSYGTGAIVEVAKVDPMPKSAGKWNTYEIIAKGNSFTVILNGQKTVDNAHSDKFASGRIALQHGMGVVDTPAWSNSATSRSGGCSSP